MTNYEKITRRIGDQSVGALERTGEALAGVTKRLADVRGRVDVPQVKVPGQLARLQGTLPALPRPSEVIEANLELTTRVLAAQKAVTLKVLSAAGPVKPVAVPAPARKSAK